MGKINKFVLIAITVAISISFVFAPLTHAKANIPEHLMEKTMTLNLIIDIINGSL